LKLFGLFPLKRVSVDVLPYDKLVAGGIPVGFIAKTDGVVVLHDAHGYRRGEGITSIDSATITSVRDMERVLGSKRPGIWVKDDTSGVGTLTYVNPENNNFAALGHKLVDNETGADVNLRSGEVYTCNVLGVEPSKADKIGTLQSTLRKATHGVQGSVLSSNSRGVFGCLNSDSVILDWCKNVYPIASRYSVKPGKATILVALDGENVVEYDAQIVKTRYQKNNSGKGIILKITDPRLLEQAGGIVHGMSGSPIIQNGHFVGAVTHVIAGDVTRGYGIYIDFIVP
jgi:stage IV sporulation protein B